MAIFGPPCLYCRHPFIFSDCADQRWTRWLCQLISFEASHSQREAASITSVKSTETESLVLIKSLMFMFHHPWRTMSILYKRHHYTYPVSAIT